MAKHANFGFGLVTYLWGKDMDLPTLIEHCAKSELGAVELRTTHKHGVEPALTPKQRAEVSARFADSPVSCIGLGSNERFDSPDPDTLKKAIEDSKDFLRLSHDIGSSGVKVKPDSFHKDVPREKTIEQIGKALNELADYGEGFGQEVRLEVHGGCAHLPDIKDIMDVADHPGAVVCWNSNKQDLAGEGLKHNFELVQERFGATAHVRELDIGDYPYQDLIKLFIEAEYRGWVLLEARTEPKDKLAALKQQKSVFNAMVAKAAS